MKIDDDSFLDTAKAIWKFNETARKEYPTPEALRDWMIEQTNKMQPDTLGWQTLGFVIYRIGDEMAAAVRGWFLNDFVRVPVGDNVP